MNLGAVVVAIFIFDVAVALVFGFATSLLALKAPKRRFSRKVPSRSDVAIQVHTTIYSMLSLLGTVLIIGVALADGVTEVFLQEQAWVAKQPWPIQLLLMFLVAYLFFGVVSTIARQATDSFTSLVKRSVEHLEATWRAYRLSKPVSEDDALLRYSFAPEWS